MSAVRSFSAARYAWLAAAVVVMAVAFFGGRTLGSGGDEGASYTYDLDTPPYTAASTGAGISKGGFSGFGANSGIDGETLVSGRVRSVSADSITLDTAGGTEVLRITGSGTLRRIEGATAAAVRPGMNVVVRTTGSGGDTASSVLLLAEP